MPKPKNCANCGRPIEAGNEVKLKGKYYGSECALKQADRINFVDLQEEWDFEDEENKDLTNQ